MSGHAPLTDPAPGDLFDRALGLLGAIPLALIVVLTFVDVFARYLFSAPVRGSVEIIESAMALMVFTALPLVTRVRGHVSVSLIDGVVHGAARRIKNVLCDAIGTLALGLLTWRLWVEADEQRRAGAATVVLGWPQAPLYFALAVLSAITTAVMLWLVWRSLRGTGSRP
jgi:TRAP-type C4-dicarboxylate transport system permease small subunit